MAIGYQLKITVRGSKPPIWRRIIVPEHIAFCDLDDIIEKLFGWTHSHLYEFYIKDWGMRITGAPLMEEEDNAEECIDSWMKEGSEILYTYDFGDNWEHLIKVEKLVEYENRYPIVLKSKGPNMIEDCGGIWGFYDCMEDAEDFDMDAVNEEFRSWNIPVAEPLDDLIGFDDYDDHDMELDGFMDDIEDDFLIENDDFSQEWRQEFKNAISGFAQEDQYVRNTFGELQTLEEVYAQFLKEDLVEIAKAHGFRGYSKYGKQKLIKWLAENLLEEQYFKEYILHADREEIETFEDAIEQKGIYLSEEILHRSLFLSTYGGYLPYYNFYNVPKDVQEKYAKLMTDDVKKEMESSQYFYDICHSSIYLYGVISISELTKIYNTYAEEKCSEVELLKKVQELLKRDEIFAFKEDYFMDERLLEENLYLDVLKEQEKMERYLPEEKEVFTSFGRNGIQEPNEDTVFFLEYLIKEANLDYPRATLAFYLIQEAIRMNQDDMELFGILSDLGCSLTRKKQFDKADQMLKKISNRTRKWDYNGHTLMELNRGIVEFPVDKRVYPNDSCPCGSGKKFKHCCGKNKK